MPPIPSAPPQLRQASPHLSRAFSQANPQVIDAGLSLPPVKVAEDAQRHALGWQWACHQISPRQDKSAGHVRHASKRASFGHARPKPSLATSPGSAHAMPAPRVGGWGGLAPTAKFSPPIKGMLFGL